MLGVPLLSFRREGGRTEDGITPRCGYLLFEISAAQSENSGYPEGGDIHDEMFGPLEFVLLCMYEVNNEDGAIVASLDIRTSTCNTLHCGIQASKLSLISDCNLRIPSQKRIHFGYDKHVLGQINWTA